MFVRSDKQSTSRLPIACLSVLFACGSAIGEPADSDMGDVDFKSMTRDSSFELAIGDRPEPTADHRRFEELSGPFATGPDVTQACLSCHTEAAKQVHATSHWTWVCPESHDRPVGKGALLMNNFCIALASNEPRCTSCHVGYGWSDKSFDFTSQEAVDCLVCHDNTGGYVKFPAGSGHPVYQETTFSGKTFTPVDLALIARNVGKPTRHNCGVCHFFGGGGEGVKHGDMDHNLFLPDRELDVHMATDGMNFQCQECHTTREHDITGRCVASHGDPVEDIQLPGQRVHRLACVSCHGQAPHSQAKLNHHSDKVSCQACHIPTMAPRKPTKVWWDWSKAGVKGNDGKDLIKRDPETGFMTYHTKKGEFRWVKDAPPEYFWLAGEIGHTTVEDVIDPSGVVTLNPIQGDYNDPEARIWPLKVHRGKQPFDTVRNRLVVPKLFGPKGSGAYWADFDWDKAIRVGMEYVDQEYSGQYGFVETEMFWPVSHMVRPKEEALGCEECHSRDGRLATLTDFYMPGRDRSWIVDLFGVLAMAGALGVVVIHGGLRIALAKRRKGAAQ